MVSLGREPQGERAPKKMISRGEAADPFDSFRSLRTGLSPLRGSPIISNRDPGAHAPGYVSAAAPRLVTTCHSIVRRTEPDGRGRSSGHGLLGHGGLAFDQEAEAGDAAADPDLVAVVEQGGLLEPLAVKVGAILASEVLDCRSGT